MNLVPFNDEDVTELVQWFDTKEEVLSWTGTDYGWPLNAQFILQRQKLEEVDSYILEHNSEKIGFIELFKVSDEQMRLCRVVLAKKARGKGVGKKLIQLALEKIADTTKAESVSLAVFKANTSALMCYLSLGFRINSNGPHSAIFDDIEWPLYQMDLMLSPIVLKKSSPP